MSAHGSHRAKRRSLIQWATAGLIVLVGSGVLAQPAPSTSPTVDTTTPPAATAPATAPSSGAVPAAAAPGEGALEGGTAFESTVDVSFKKQANISGPEMIAKGKENIESLQDTLTRLVQLQDLATKNGDVIKLNCVNEKILLIKELLNIAEGALTNIHEAIARNNENERYHQFSRLTIAYQKGTALQQEGDACLGDGDQTWTGPTDVSVEIDLNIPDDPPPVVEEPPVPPPITASPTS